MKWITWPFQHTLTNTNTHLSISVSRAVFQSLHSWISPEGKPISTGGHSFIRLVSFSLNLSPLHPNITSSSAIHSQVSTGKNLCPQCILSLSSRHWPFDLFQSILKSTSFSRYIDLWSRGRQWYKTGINRNEKKSRKVLCATSVTKQTAKLITEHNSPEVKCPCIFSDNF